MIEEPRSTPAREALQVVPGLAVRVNYGQGPQDDTALEAVILVRDEAGRWAPWALFTTMTFFAIRFFDSYAPNGAALVWREAGGSWQCEIKG